MAYLDHAGATLPSEMLLKESFDLLRNVRLANPHSRHAISRATKQIVDNARERILSHFATTSKEYSVIFTSNTTHSLQIVADSFDFGERQSEKECNEILRHFPDHGGSSFVYMHDCHNSVLGLREIVRNKIGPHPLWLFIKDSLKEDNGVDSVSCIDYDDVDFTQVKRVSRGLCVITAESNFCGRIYDQNVVSQLRDANYCVMLDAAALVANSSLNLRKVPADFVAFSFYKMFGYPTGLGALLVKKESEHMLIKRFFSGGTVAMACPRSFISQQNLRVENRFEDGTSNFQAIAVLQKAFDKFDRFASTKSHYAYKLAREAYRMLTSKQHPNGHNAVVVYSHDEKSQGAIVAFNMLNEAGEYIGYSEVEKMANLFGIQLRTGCFCNIGACQRYLQLTDEELVHNHASGKECGDEMDIVSGKPSGAVRISFGMSSSHKDIEALEQMIDFCFLREQSTTYIEHVFPVCDYTATLSKLLCYPVKSCSGIELESSTLCSTGLEYDRLFAIISDDITLTQKSHPQLCRLKTQFLADNNTLRIAAKTDANAIDISLANDKNSPQHRVVCSGSVATQDCGEEVAEWLDSVLELSNCRMKQITSESTKSLSNQSPYLLVNEASIKLLADEIGLKLDEALLRFRPNLIVRGIPPFIEDTITTFSIGDVQFEATDKCTRCEMICVDSDTGVKDPSMIIALRNFRRREKNLSKDNKVLVAALHRTEFDISLHGIFFNYFRYSTRAVQIDY